MALGSTTLQLIRRLFRKQDFERPPYIPPVGYQGLSTQQSFFGHGMPSEIQGLSDNLRIDSELVSRFVDYEDMDDTPLPSCLTGDTVVTTVAGQFTLKELSEKYREMELFSIIAFDTERRQFVVSDAHHPRKTKTDKIIKITFDDGNILRCTSDHKVLSFAGEWTEAGRLCVGQSVMACKMILSSNVYQEIGQKVTKIEDAGIEDVYDLTTEKHHNFLANNVVVHNSAMEIYTEDATQTDSEKNQSVWIECEDGEIKRELENLLQSRLKIEERVYEDVRTLVKYGNFYAEIVVKENIGVIALNSLTPPSVRRIELPKEIGQLSYPRVDTEADTLGFIYDPKGMFRLSTAEFIQELNNRVHGGDSNKETTMHGEKHHVVVFEGWEILHCRLRGKQPTSPYGFGVGEPARWIFKRLQLLEDSVMMHRLTRSPSRFAFYIDVSQIPPSETSGYLNRVKQALKKQKFTNPQTGKFDLKFDPLSVTDDFFLPVRDGKESTRVESLQGPVYDHIEDIRFFEEKLFAAFRIPRPFLTYENTTAKSHLSAEDARFARSVLRVQREYMSGIKKVCRVHLAARGVNPDTIDFKVKMTIPSAIFELSQLEIRNAEIELADRFGAWAPKSWIMKNVLGFSQDEVIEMAQLQKNEAEGGDEAVRSGSSGALERALSKRGQPFSTTASVGLEKQAQPESQPELAWRNFKRNEVLVNSKKVSDRMLIDKIEEIRLKNKAFDQKLTETRNLLKDIGDRLK